MAELLPQFLNWIDTQKLAAARGIASLLANPLAGLQPQQNEAFAQTPQERVQQALQQGDIRDIAVGGAPDLAGTPLPKGQAFLQGMDDLFKHYITTSSMDAGAAKDLVKQNYSKLYGETEAIKNWTPKTIEDVPFPKLEYDVNNPPRVASWSNPERGPPTVERFPADLEDRAASHGVDIHNLKTIRRYTGEQYTQILDRFDDAREAAIKYGLPADNTAADRARLMGWPDIGDPKNYWMRGSGTSRPELMPERTKYGAVFVSAPGGSAYKGFGDIHTPYLMRDVNQLWDQSVPEHLAEFKKAEEQISADPSILQGMGINPIEWPYRRGIHSYGPDYRDWGAIEGRSSRDSPRVNMEVIKQTLNRPGFFTTEGVGETPFGFGANAGLFDPSLLRHPLAAFNPDLKFSRNQFAGLLPLGTVGGLAAAMAQQQIPVDSVQ